MRSPSSRPKSCKVSPWPAVWPPPAMMVLLSANVSTMRSSPAMPWFGNVMVWFSTLTLYSVGAKSP